MQVALHASSPHPNASTVVNCGDAFDWQATRCSSNGAPIAAHTLWVCAAVARLNSGPLEFLPTHVRFGDHIPLRVMAALHYLALTRRVPLLATYFPTVGGSATIKESATAFSETVIDALAQHRDVIVEFVAQVPQTNEPGRQAVLRRVLKEVDPMQPVDLHELGCSAGLNLLIDIDGQTSGVVYPPIVSRQGCDLNPVDISTADGRARLSSYVWVDDTDRFAKLGRALTQAMAHPPTVHQATVSDYIAQIKPVAGHTTVVWQSAVQPYLGELESARLSTAFAELIRTLPVNTTLVYATWEDAGDSADAMSAFALRVRTWRSNIEIDAAAEQLSDSVDMHTSDRIIARGSAHGAHLRDIAQH